MSTTRSTTTCTRGDVVVVSFLYANQRGSKSRPAIVLSSDWYSRGRDEVVLAAVTSNVHRDLPGDILLRDWTAAGLVRPSVATGIIRTVKQDDLIDRMGVLSGHDLAAVESNLRRVLGL